MFWPIIRIQECVTAVSEHIFLSSTTYLDTLNYYCVLVVQDAGDILIFNCADILFQTAAHDHDLPLAAVFGHAAVFTAAVATCLQE